MSSRVPRVTFASSVSFPGLAKLQIAHRLQQLSASCKVMQMQWLSVVRESKHRGNGE